jgi:hypothetical protein
MAYLITKECGRAFPEILHLMAYPRKVQGPDARARR